LELIKVVQNCPRECFKRGSVNLSSSLPVSTTQEKPPTETGYFILFLFIFLTFCLFVCDCKGHVSCLVVVLGLLGIDFQLLVIWLWKNSLKNSRFLKNKLQFS